MKALKEKRRDFDFEAALKAGYSEKEILAFLEANPLKEVKEPENAYALENEKINELFSNLNTTTSDNHLNKDNALENLPAEKNQSTPAGASQNQANNPPSKQDLNTTVKANYDAFKPSSEDENIKAINPLQNLKSSPENSDLSPSNNALKQGFTKLENQLNTLNDKPLSSQATQNSHSDISTKQFPSPQLLNETLNNPLNDNALELKEQVNSQNNDSKRNNTLNNQESFIDKESFKNSLNSLINEITNDSSQTFPQAPNQTLPNVEDFSKPEGLFFK